MDDPLDLEAIEKDVENGMPRCGWEDDPRRPVVEECGDVATHKCRGGDCNACLCAVHAKMHGDETWHGVDVLPPSNAGHVRRLVLEVRRLREENSRLRAMIEGREVVRGG